LKNKKAPNDLVEKHEILFDAVGIKTEQTEE
jgi:hypothetical protein